MNHRHTSHRLSAPGVAPLCAALLVVTASSPAAAGGRAAALGPGGFAAERGIIAAALNPAQLALDAAPRWSVSLLGIDAAAGNNAFSLDDYKRYNGTFLDENDKAAILTAIDEQAGLESFGSSRGVLPGLQVGPVALFLITRAAASDQEPKTLFETALIGADLHDELQINAHADATLWSEVGVAYGRAQGRLRYGGAAKLLIGHYWNRSWSKSTLTPILADSILTSVASDAGAYIQSAEGGTGFGLDLGCAWESGPTLVSIAVSNLYSRIRWDRDPWLEGSALHSDDLVGEEFPDAEDTDRAIEPFTDAVPTTWRLGATRRLNSTWLALAGYTHDSVAGSEFGVGAEWSRFGWLSLRAGVAYASVVGLRLSSGFGLALGPLRWDLSVTQGGGLINGVHGLGLATTLSWVNG